jgi:G6PDH family F420-dependent oxidoreductase
MLDGRFTFGIGTGENLNEHVVGERWPGHRERLEMLEEAVDVIRSLWTGEQVDHDGTYYTVDRARLYTLPAEPPPIHVAASGPNSAQSAGEIGDGLISTAPKSAVVKQFRDSADREDLPRYGQVTGCVADGRTEAAEIAVANWANAGLPGELSRELPTPKHFDQASELVGPAELEGSVALGKDPQEYVENVRTFADAGFDHVSINNVNPDFEGAFEFFAEEVVPEFS